MKSKLTAQEKKWVLYDVGNSAFILLVTTIVPIYFNSLAKNGGLDSVQYLAYWGYAASAATLLVALSGQLYLLHGQVAEAQAQKDALSSRVAEQQQINDQLQAGIDNGGSEEEMKKIAREELDLVDPNEKIFYDTSN